MNPLDWRGPEFLLFYALFTSALLIGQWWMRKTREMANGEAPRLEDAYEIAYLRGGANETLRVAVVTLLEQGVIQRAGIDQLVAQTDAVRTGNALEQAVAGFYASTRKAEDIFRGALTSWPIKGALESYERSLTQRGLLVSEEQKSARVKDVLVTLGIALVGGAAKMALGVSRGKPVGFLALLMLAAFVISLAISAGRLTSLGKRTIANIRELFGGLETRARESGANRLSAAEIGMMAAVFGMPLIASQVRPDVKQLFPRAANGAGDMGSASSCGSSCGSSAGCGGGGGGGCGGCGGGGD